MAKIEQTKIVPFLWFERGAEDAARLYTSLLPGSEVRRVSTLPSESPSGPPGSVKIVEFTLAGQPFTAMDAGKLDPFNHAVSFAVSCADQAEVDRLWDGLSAGGTVEQCGWLRDRWGVCWQIIPERFMQMLSEDDPARVKRVMDAMLKMVKFDIAALERAYAG